MMPGLRPPKDTHGREIDLAAIADLLDRVVHRWHPLGIWLFGSRARGEVHAASDWDLLAIVPDNATDVDDPLAGWLLKKDLGVRSDLLLCRASEFEEDRNTPNTIAFEAAHDGVLIYER